MFWGNPLFPLFHDAPLAAVFSPERTLQHYLAFEAALTAAVAASGLVDGAAARGAQARLSAFVGNPCEIGAAGREDGLPVPAFVRALRRGLPQDVARAIHFGATSQDVMDSALALTLQEASAIIAERLDRLTGALRALADGAQGSTIMARTRMQAALPVAVSHRVRAWHDPLSREAERFAAAAEAVAVLQLGGPVGTRAPWVDAADAVGKHVAAALHLREPGSTWHTARDNLALYGASLARLSAALGKLGMDIALMAQQGIDEIALIGGGTSSAMPHKQNPVRAELLVTLAHANAHNLGLLQQSAVHEQERSGSAWALEWIVLPPMCHAAGLGLARAIELVDAIERIGAPQG